MFLRLLFLCLAATFALVALANPIDELAERPAAVEKAYGYVYFVGEGLSNGEQIYFAVSKGNSPASWKVVNAGKPVLTSTLGERGIRDPYIIRDPARNKFFIVATDLRIYEGRGWEAAKRTGSMSLAIWESSDLKNWSKQRLVEVSPATAGMTWAPEVTYVDGKFVVYWASNLFPENDPAHTNATYYSRILYATTTDFHTFTPAAVWIDKGKTIIDTSVACDAATSSYHRFSAFEDYILQETSTSFFGTWTTVNPKIGWETKGVEGPLLFQSNQRPGVWHMFADGLNPQGYIPYETSNITAGVWTRSTGYVLPPNSRHGTVIPITAAEAANLASISV